MNNRNSGRRRSRGGRPNNRGPNDGNRLDNRARGNANQLCEKYKSMARDAHQQGDRVMNEYYLQFADHYFRVQAETNLRKEEQKREREESKAAQRSGEAQDKSDREASPETDKAEDEPKKRAPRKKRESQNRESKTRETEDAAPDGEEQKIEADRLPAAFSVSASADGGEAVNGAAEKKTVKRTRARKADKDEDDKGAVAEA